MIRLMTAALALAVALPMQADMALAKSKHCPPGLAKKEPACVPPGQAKKGVTAEEWQGRNDDVASRDDDNDDDGYDVGDRLDRDRWLVLEEGDRVTIDGREYVVVDTDNGTILRAQDDWYRLPDPTEGTDWVRVGEEVFRVDPETREIIELIELSRLILN
jgi:Ni/Co efflux regulator RcnB